jgi:hypothetical protein
MEPPLPHLLCELLTLFLSLPTCEYAIIFLIRLLSRLCSLLMIVGLEREAPEEPEEPTEAPEPEQTQAPEEPTEVPEEPEQPTTVRPNGCESVVCDPEQFDVQYHPNPSDCGSFCQCSNGVPVYQLCPVGLEFNPTLNVCDWPQNAGCTSGRN